MKFFSIDNETREVSEIIESRTLAELKRCVNTAIGRWLISGAECPDYRASDGVSEYEASLSFPVE
jgi:hypothetical protein